MLFLVRMQVTVPDDVDVLRFERLKAQERERTIDLQRDGRWVHLWRVVGRYENYSVFEVDSHEALHDILFELPLRPFMSVDVIPLAVHPSRFEPDGSGAAPVR